MKKYLFSAIVGMSLIGFIAASGVPKAPSKTEYHVKTFNGSDVTDEVKNHIISFYRKGYTVKSTEITSDGYSGYDDAIVVMEKN